MIGTGAPVPQSAQDWRNILSQLQQWAGTEVRIEFDDKNRSQITIVCKFKNDDLRLRLEAIAVGPGAVINVSLLQAAGP